MNIAQMFPYATEKYSDTSLSNIIFTPDMIKMMLLNLNVNKSVSPDNIHPYMLKKP